MVFLSVVRHALAANSFSELFIENHRCWVVAPEDLRGGDPVGLILPGTGTSGNELVSLCDQLHLPPCLFVLPDGPFRASHGKTIGHAWYDPHTHNRQDIEKSRDYLFSVLD